ncbi:MAG: tetratricopeptide repeat protein [Actinomycetales bacterium]|nr:tetratricopeptide repeat protein [Actinomycetales bacterium]
MYRPRPARKPEPEIPEHIEAGQLDRAARRELLTLSKENADGVARHLVAATEALAENDLDGALAHAENASRRAGRVAVVREVLGFVYYRRAEWAEALREFRTARRLSGSNHLLPQIADVERGLGRPDRAIELSQEAAADALSAADRVELAIVVSGARRDLGQAEAAVQTLRDLVHASPPQRSWAPRLYYAYADALLAIGDEEEARGWFARAVDADKDALTDAPDRLAELDGIDITDVSPEDAESEGGNDTGSEDELDLGQSGEDESGEDKSGEDEPGKDAQP